MEIYQVIIQDEWNNLYEIGYYKDLNDALPDINDFLHGYDVELVEGDLAVYPSTLGSCFDTCVGEVLEDRNTNVDETLYSVYIRGFFVDGEALTRHLIDLTTQVGK